MRLIRRITRLFLVAAACSLLPADDVSERQRADLDATLKILPPTRPFRSGVINRFGDRTWEDWQRRTGELPPDFASMPSRPMLPDPMVRLDSPAMEPIRTKADWERQRKWIRAQFEKWIFGTMPPAPDNLRAVVIAQKKEGTATVRDVRLEFGPGHRGLLNIQVIIPDGKGPFPVFLTNHSRQQPRLYTAVRRGYIAAVYYATDPAYGHADDSEKFVDVYPEYDFSTLARWAWSASRTVDYLYTMPEVDKAKIGITGHSRNGKQALLAAAFDERITAAIPTSGNTGEGNPWRYTTDTFANESIEQITGNFPHWFHPRLRFFAGREHKLPVDQNLLMAMVAPRGLMLHSGYAESQGNPFGFEQAYRSAMRVYRFLNAEQNLWLHLRAGEHSTTAGDAEFFLDFFDTVFGRKKFSKSETWTHGYTFDGWRAIAKEDKVDARAFPVRSTGELIRGADARDWGNRRQEIRERIRWTLGEEPPYVPFPARTQLGRQARTDNWLAMMFNRPITAAGMGAASLPFGDGLRADAYYPIGADGRIVTGKLPAVVWLHSHAYAVGYSRNMARSIPELVKRGFIVMAFDQIGFGTRVLDAKNFYAQYPKWSLMGRMVADTIAAIDALAALSVVDRDRIYLSGYGLGAKVGLFTAALDNRVAGLAAVGGVEALRDGNPETEGVRHYSHLHGLIPRFGYFVGNEERLPIDYDDLLAATAPRPVLVVAPALDRYAPLKGVQKVTAAAAAAYRLLGAEAALRFETPFDFNRYPRATQEKVFAWLERLREQ